MAKIVTITNPLTGQPAQVDQLDHTAQQIDDGLNIARGVSNPNLLDSWYFGNPVDQRGGYVYPPNSPYADSSGNQIGATSQYLTIDKSKKSPFSDDWAEISIDGTTYYGYITYAVRGYTGAGYGIDRWYLGAGTLLIKDGYVQVVGGSFSERFKTAKIIDGQIYTASWLTYEGKLHTASGVLSKDSTGWQIDHWDGNIFIGVCKNSNDTFRTEISDSTGNPINLKASKLEFGSQQTLAHQENGVWVLNEIPDYGEQLARCQMRQIVLDATPGFAVGRCFKASDTFGNLMIPVPCSFGNGNVAVVTTGDFRNVGYNVYADIPSSALSTTGRVVGGMCVIDINANVVGDGMLDSGSSGRIILDRNL